MEKIKSSVRSRYEQVRRIRGLLGSTRLCVHVDSANGRQDGASVVVGQHGGWRRVAMLAALESGVGQVRSGRYHRLCAPPSTDFHFPSVTPPRSGSGWRHQPPSLRRFPILNVKRKTSSEFRVHSAVFDHTTLQRCSLCD